MAQKYSFIFLGSSGATVRQLNFSFKNLIVIGICLLFGFIAFGYGAIDYFSLHLQAQKNEALSVKLAQQTEEVVLQRKQIQKFAQEMNTFKEKLVQLEQFEDNIRIIANIDKPNNGDGLFGIGGSTPGDLNPDIELNQRHQGLIKNMHQQMGHLNHATSVQQKDFEYLFGKLEAQKNRLAHTPTIRPVRGWVTSRFGYRQSPFTGKREFHKGLDIANRKGTPIVATADGVVTFEGKKGLLGKMVKISHGHGIVTRYAHLDKTKVKKGERVKRGDVIAHMGNSGRSTGPHLHYEVRLNGVPVNPTTYILN